MNRTAPFSFPEQRVLEDAAFARGVVPTRIFALLLPVWSVTIQADITEAEDYELIDRFLARGIAEGGLRTTAELAAFYALEPELVDRALRALVAIQHLVPSGDGWELTPIGLASVRDRKKYIVTREDRRMLYFAAFGSQPLARQYYDTRKITLIPAARTDEIRSGGGPLFHVLFPTRGLDGRALEALAANPDRDRFNLPERIERPRRLGSDELVHLPLYVVRGRTSRGGRCHLAYNQAAAEADPDMSDLIDRTPEIVTVLDAEVASVRHDDDAKRARDWPDKRGLGEHRPERAPSGGSLRVRLPASRFGKDGLPVDRVGTFVVQGNGFFQLWCTDAAMRRRALLARVNNIMARWSTMDRDAIAGRVDRIARQLELGSIDLAELRDIARANDHGALSAQLDRVLSA
ncbi:MAG: hypothetical protein GEV28_27185 [Actinophytocola sp.]|uniref:hypothetical protein n=1 Tax=Actinophytocola sp. TaxID=1872138 RepID=UPI001323C3FB|nr:hypothetical protein [Actinophytocola sp.]MPZ83877.1 hypothetical protein [Actinophytocola sp.]